MGDHHVHLHPHEPAPGGPPPGEYPDGLIESYVETALGRGADEVGFTEHLYRCVEAGPVLGPFWESEEREDLAAQAKRFVAEDRTLSLEAYVEAVTTARDRGLPVRLGLEVDYFPATIDSILELLAPYPWDFLIGSVHWVGGWSIDHDDVVHEFDRRGVDRAYHDYFALEERLAASGTVDVLAHADVVKKFGHRPGFDPVDLYRRVAAAAARSGTAVEVSTAGLHKTVAEMYPARVFLGEFHAAGVPITLASDAHSPQECARDRDEAIAYARAAGYTDRIRFERRVESAFRCDGAAPGRSADADATKGPSCNRAPDGHDGAPGAGLPERTEEVCAMTGGQDRSMHWTGLLLVLGSGIGMTFGLIVAGGTGIALGAAFGAALGLVIGAAIDAVQRTRRDDAGLPS